MTKQKTTDAGEAGARDAGAGVAEQDGADLAAAMRLEPSGETLARLRRDVEDLAALDRRATSPGERRSAMTVAQRLEDLGARDVELETGRALSSGVWPAVGHAAIGILSALVGGRLARAAALAAIVSYEADYTGRNKWLRRLIPAGQTTNVTARIPSAGATRATLVLVAHHDAAHTGWVWHPRALAAYRAVAARTGTTPPYSTPLNVALALCASRRRGRRLAGVAQLAFFGAILVQAARSPTAPGANDNATGVAALLELARRIAADPLPGVEVQLVSPGAEEVGVDGMTAWVRRHRGRLDPSTTLVVGLDSLGGGEPVVVERESLTAHYRQEDLHWADEGARRAGLPAPGRVRMAVNTDPMVARHAGLPAVSVLSMTDGWLGKFHQMDDTPANVDWGSVNRCLTLTAGIVDAYAATRGSQS